MPVRRCPCGLTPQVLAEVLPQFRLFVEQVDLRGARLKEVITRFALGRNARAVQQMLFRWRATLPQQIGQRDRTEPGRRFAGGTATALSDQQKALAPAA